MRRLPDKVIYLLPLLAVGLLQVLLIRGAGQGPPPGDIHDLLKGPELWAANGGALPTLAQILGTYSPCDDYPPPLMLLGQMLLLVCTGSLRLLPLTNLAYLAGFGLAYWVLIRRISSGGAASLALALLLTQPFALWVLLAVGPEAPLLCLTAGLCLALHDSQGLARRGPTLAAILLLGLMSLTKVTFFLHAAGPVAITVWRALRGRRWTGLLLLVGGALLLSLPWYVFNLERLLCYISGNLAAGSSGTEDFLFRDFLPGRAARVVHGLGPVLLGLLLLGVWLRPTPQDMDAGPARQPDLAFLLACCAPALLLALAIGLIRGALPLLELTVGLPAALALAAHFLLTRTAPRLRPALFAMAGSLVFFNLLSFAPMPRLLPPPPGATPVSMGRLHQEVTRTLLEDPRLGAGPVRLVNKSDLPYKVMLDPICYWWAALSQGRDLEFRCQGCREERYEMQRELEPGRQPTLEVIFGGDGPAHLKVEAGVLGPDEVSVEIRSISH